MDALDLFEGIARSIQGGLQMNSRETPQLTKRVPKVESNPRIDKRLVAAYEAADCRRSQKRKAAHPPTDWPKELAHANSVARQNVRTYSKGSYKPLAPFDANDSE